MASAAIVPAVLAMAASSSSPSPPPPPPPSTINPNLILLRRCNTPPFLSSSSSFLASSISISVCHSQSPPFSLVLRCGYKRVPRVLAVVDEEQAARTREVEAEEETDDEDGAFNGAKVPARPCELYVCNLPRSCDIPELLDLFKPYGTVQSVEVSRNSETGISRGCGYVTMCSISEAKAAMAALDGSDLGGRELRVKFSAVMVSGRKNIEALNTAPKKNIYFESPHKVYVGNISRSIRPEELREHFCQFGTVVSTRLLHDKKAGKNRVYGFISFSSAEPLKAALLSSGKEFHGRTLLVREVAQRES